LTAWLLASTVSSAIAFVVLFGVFSGAVIGLPPASVAWIIQNTHGDLSKLGQWTGMMYTTAAIPALTGPVIAGHLISEFGTYVTVQAWSGTCLFLAGFCMWMSVMETRRGRKRAEREKVIRGKSAHRDGDGDMVDLSAASTCAREESENESEDKEKGEKGYGR
jgi:MFS transporter, MCT family, solute carrier family 16 (monocarboxylic acid transporters), member 10